MAAVGSYLEIARQGGTWHLRFDDLDRPRVALGSRDAILRTLTAFGFRWDELSFQSQRQGLYHAMMHQLNRQGRLYPCACSRQAVEAGGRTGATGPIYAGTCREGLPPGRSARALRLRVDEAEVSFRDGLQGEVAVSLEAEGGDFVVYRSDGAPTFHLATAVDDALQGFTQVVRGADLLESTGRQILLHRLLHLPTPRYLHLPVAVDASGSKLSKQSGAPPLDPTNPVPALCRAFTFLGQELPLGAPHWALQDFWREARLRWTPQRLPRARQLPAPM